MIKIPLKQPIRIGSVRWCEMLDWSSEHCIKIKYNSKTVFFYNKHAEDAIAFKLRFGL